MRVFSSIIITLLCGAVISGCQADNTTYAIGGNDELSQLTITLPETKTALGEKVNDVYRVYWSEGDCLGVNGVQSQEAVINEENRNIATFSFDDKVGYPLNITYPFTTGTTAETPKVVLPTEQSYVEGTFAQGAAPMCGYVANKGDKAALTHLAGVLRFSVKATTEGTTLQKIVITSTDGAKLSGEFAVNCSAGTMTAGADAESSITYTLPDNFTLSTSLESVFYITLPAGNTGDCEVAFVESSGEKMVCTWESKDIKAGIVREFKTITYRRGVSGELESLVSDEDTLEIYYPTVYGYVKDTSGNPIKGVAVSDGFRVVATDEKGFYSMSVSADAWYIYISVPAEYEIPTNEHGQPCFYKKFPSDEPQYDFTLTPLKGGKESRFALFTFADPQVSSATGLTRFQKESIPNIRAHADQLSATTPCYGITLGDIISNGNSRNSGEYRDDMRDGFSVSSVGMPVFQVMGNHDNTYFNSQKPLFSDDRSSTFELKAQREHEDIFGPANYSFNRGDVHIVGMRDIIYNINTSCGEYSAGFLPSQYEWLKQDLALVPKDKMVVLCVHIQLLNRSYNYIPEVLSLLDTFKEAHVMSGHTHIQHLYEHSVESTGHKIFEHNTCAVCGAWWSSNLAGDGTPNGYNVFISENGTFTNWYYMGVNEGMNSQSHQMRLYRGNEVTGAEITGSNTTGLKGYYAFNFADDVLLANIYNADSKWTIQVYENGVYTGNMTKVPSQQPSFKSLIGDYTYNNPRRAADGVVTSHDFYVAGLQLSVVGRDSDNGGSWSTCYHMYQYKLKSKDADIKVVAIDRFGNRYTETKLTVGTDYSLAIRPKW